MAGMGKKSEIDVYLAVETTQNRLSTAALLFPHPQLKSIQQSLSGILRQSKVTLAMMPENVPERTGLKKQLIHPLLYSGRMDCALMESAHYKPNQLTALLCAFLSQIAAEFSASLLIHGQFAGHEDVKLNNALKKAGVPAQVENVKDARESCRWCAGYLAWLLIRDDEAMVPLTRQKTYYLAEFLQPAKSLKPDQQRLLAGYFQTLGSLQSPFYSFLLRCRCTSAALSRMLDEIRQGNLSEELIMQELGGLKNSREFDGRLEQLLEKTARTQAMDWQHCFGQPSEEILFNGTAGRLFSMLYALVYDEKPDFSNLSGAFEKACANPAFQQAVRQLAWQLTEQPLCEEEPVVKKGQVLVSEKNGLVYALVSPDFFQLEKKLRSLLVNLTLQPAESFSLNFTSVSRANETIYEHLLAGLPADVFWIVKADDLPSLMDQVAGWIHDQPAAYYARYSMGLAIKEELLKRNELGYIHPIPESGRLPDFLNLLADFDQYYDLNQISVNKRHRPGKEQSALRFMDFMASRWLPRSQLKPALPAYLPKPLAFSEEQLQFLAQPSLSMPVTRRLAQAIQQGLSMKTLSYIRMQAQSEEEFQIRLRSVLASYCCISRVRRYLDELLKEENPDLDRMDYYLTGKLSLSRIQVIERLAPRDVPFVQVRQHLSFGMSVSRMEQVLKETSFESREKEPLLDLDLIQNPDWLEALTLARANKAAWQEHEAGQLLFEEDLGPYARWQQRVQPTPGQLSAFFAQAVQQPQIQRLKALVPKAPDAESVL